MARPDQRITSDDSVALSGTDYVEVAKYGSADAGRYLNIEFENVGGGSANDVADFKLQLKDHPEGEWYDYLSDTDWDAVTLNAMLFATTTGPHEVTSGDVAHAHVDIHAAYGVKFVANCAQGEDTTVRLKARMRLS